STGMDGGVLSRHALLHCSGGGGGDLRADLGGGDREEAFVHLDAVAVLLEPPGHGALGDALPEFRQCDGVSHQFTDSLELCDRCDSAGLTIVAHQSAACSGLPASARCASPSASACVGCG